MTLSKLLTLSKLKITNYDLRITFRMRTDFFQCTGKIWCWVQHLKESQHVLARQKDIPNKTLSYYYHRSIKTDYFRLLLVFSWMTFSNKCLHKTLGKYLYKYLFKICYLLRLVGVTTSYLKSSNIASSYLLYSIILLLNISFALPWFSCPSHSSQLVWLEFLSQPMKTLIPDFMAADNVYILQLPSPLWEAILCRWSLYWCCQDYK